MGRSRESSRWRPSCLLPLCSLVEGCRTVSALFPIALTGSLLFSLSFFLFSRVSSLHSLYFFYGVLGGIGTGLGYGVVVPVMAKWFPDKTGLATGLALGGFGGGSAVFGSIANLVLFPHFGWRVSCLLLAAIFLPMTMIGAFLLRNPPIKPQPKMSGFDSTTSTGQRQFTPAEVLSSASFYLLWLGVGLGSTAGLMVISQLIPFAKNQGITSAALATMGLVVGACGNASGRVLSGWISDLIGRLNTLRLVLTMSAVAMPVLYWAGARLIALYVLIFAVYFGYGGLSSVIPATVSDFWGTRYAGSNYGAIFTAWGFSGILGPTIGGVLFDRYRDYGAAFYTASVLATVALICVIVARRPSDG